jgi:hypothetical protein
MKHYPGMGTPEMKRQQVFFTPERYETLMTCYFGDFDHISGQVRPNSTYPVHIPYCNAFDDLHSGVGILNNL